jgi:hypothetical protein
MAHQWPHRNAHFSSDASLQTSQAFEVPECLLNEILVSIECREIQFPVRSELETNMAEALATTMIVVIKIRFVELELERL